jgi:hypothetical protein
MSSNIIISSDLEPFNRIREFLSESQHNITIFSPYIKTEALRELLPELNVKVTLITSWKLQDLWLGSSDLSLYPFAKQRSYSMFLNNKIHLKVFMTDWQRCILGSSNISNKGLGIGIDCHYELDVIHSIIDTDTLLYLRRILSESVLMNDKLYLKYKEVVGNLPNPPQVPEPCDFELLPETDFLISSLPMSLNIHKLYEIYANSFSGADKEATDCAMHDIALYGIPIGLSREGFISYIKKAFYESSFIRKLLLNINEDGMYFGQVKTWIQNNCADVPVPSRRDLTGNIQVLYRWIIDLSDGRYSVDRPNYSERLYKVKDG